MSAIEEIATAINALGEQIEEAANAVRDIDSNIDDASSTASALGANATVEGLAQLSSEIQALAQQLLTAGESAKDASATAQAVADST